MASVRAQMTALRRKQPLLNNAALFAEIAALQALIANQVISELREYPPELTNQRYVRTGTLGRSWRRSAPRVLASAGLVTSVVNNATDRQGKRYASLVQGNDQKPIHQGRWLRLSEAMEKHRTEYRVGLAAIMRRHGLT